MERRQTASIQGSQDSETTYRSNNNLPEAEQNHDEDWMRLHGHIENTLGRVLSVFLFFAVQCV